MWFDCGLNCPSPRGWGALLGCPHQIYLCEKITALELEEQKEDKCYYDYTLKVPTLASMNYVLLSELFLLSLVPRVLHLSSGGHLGRESCVVSSPPSMLLLEFQEQGTNRMSLGWT